MRATLHTILTHLLFLLFATASYLSITPLAHAQLLPRCGDTTIDWTAGETCDDGNTNDCDGCSSSCTIEIGTPAGCGVTTIPSETTTPSEANGVILLEQSLPGVGDESGVVADLGEYLNGMFLVGIGVATALAAITLTVGGVQYMFSAAMGSKEAGKEKITAAIWGLVLALGAFLILNTINPDLLRFKIDDAIETIKKETQSRNVGNLGAFWPSDREERQRMIVRTTINGNQKVFFKSSDGQNTSCEYVNQTGCTSIAEIGEAAYNGVYEIVVGSAENNSSRKPCPVVITAGTEYWAHSENTKHKPGNAVLDSSPSTDCFDRYILSERKDIDTSRDLGSGCLPGIEKGGAVFSWEGAECGDSTAPHWHVEFK